MNDRSSVALYFDPSSPRFLEDRLFDINEVPFGGEQLLAPYVHLKETLSSHGVPVHTIDYLPEEEQDDTLNLYVALSNLDNYHQFTDRSDTMLSACFAFECPVVDPGLYRKLNQAQHAFKRVFSWSDSASLERFVGGPLECKSFVWPQSFDGVHESIWHQTDRDFLVMINSNKISPPDPQELYRERIRAVAFFSEYDEIDVFGVGWDEPSLRVGVSHIPWTLRRLEFWLRKQWERVRPSPQLEAVRRVYRGRAESKSETLGQYTFALCFENMTLKGWITEKIFDCFFAGTVPIYWGAPDIEDYIPSTCYIDMRDFDDYDELRRYLKSLEPTDIRRYKENARRFLQSEDFEPFSKDAFVDIFVRLIEDDAGMDLSSPASFEQRSS